MGIHTKGSPLIRIAMLGLMLGSLCYPLITVAEEPLKEPEDNGEIFYDVNLGDDHYVAIKFLKEKHMVSGFSDGKFHVDDPINRVEALQILAGVFPRVVPKKAPTIPTFADVKDSDWFFGVVQNALKNRVVNGYPDKLFHPEKNLILAEAAKMMALQQNGELPTTMEEAPYSDVPVDVWFAPYAQLFKDHGVVLETRQNSDFLPGKTVSRGEFSEMIYRLYLSQDNYQFGRATFYADSLAGRGTSSGDTYQPGVFTTAHKTLPFGTHLLVTNLANGKSIEVEVNDRGPYANGVELDLSKSAFSAIAKTGIGIITTQFKILE